jgi:hypothetical protein
LSCGCVRRTITITSEPAGALCWLNGREVGRTPVTVDFLYYGNYDVQLTHDGYEPLLTAGEAKSPWWDILPLDMAAEAVPGEPRADIRWHYAMQPRETDRPALIDRAQQLREKLLTEAPAPPATAPATAPQAATTPPPEPATAPDSQPGETPVTSSPTTAQERP